MIERFDAAPPRSNFGVYAGTDPQNPYAMALLDLDLFDASLIEGSNEALAKAVSGSPELIRTVAINKPPNAFPIADPSEAHNGVARLVASRLKQLAMRLILWNAPELVS